MDLQNLVFIVVIVGVFYFLVIRPQQTRTRKQRDMIAALKPGDEIVTIGGIYATVVSVDERVRVALADGTELEVAKQALAQALPPSKDASDEPEVEPDDEQSSPEGSSDSDSPEVADDVMTPPSS